MMIMIIILKLKNSPKKLSYAQDIVSFSFSFLFNLFSIWFSFVFQFPFFFFYFILEKEV